MPTVPEWLTRFLNDTYSVLSVLAVLSTTDTIFFSMVIIVMNLTGFLLAVYVQDELWRQTYAPDDGYMKIFSHQSIGLKIGLMCIVLILALHHIANTRQGVQRDTAPEHMAILGVLLLIALHRLHGRHQVRDYARRRDRRQSDTPHHPNRRATDVPPGPTASGTDTPDAQVLT